MSTPTQSKFVSHWRMRTLCRAARPLAIAACAACVSCESPSHYSAMDDPAEVHLDLEEPDSAAEIEQDGAHALATIAQRDVEALLAMRESSNEATGSAQPAVTEPPEIFWNQPARRSSAAGTRSKPGSDAAPTLLASDPKSLDPVKGPGEVDDELSEDAPANERSALDADHLREMLVALSKELYREASYADMPLRELLLIAATTLVSPDRALVPEAIPGLTDRERELLAHFQSFFTELGTKLDGSRNADDVLRIELEALRERLINEPQLELGTLALCTRVGGFGDYTPFKKNAFLAHTEQQAIVYIEIAGFTSELNPKSEWVTELSQQLVIYSERDGIPVWREDWQSAVDVSRNQRNDFFVVQIITLPKALSVGKYHLKVRVRDEKSKAEAEGSIDFEMVADPRMATGQ